MAENEDNQEKMETESMSAIDVVTGAVKMLDGKKISLHSDRKSTSQFPCTGETCPWKKGKYVWKMYQSYNWPFQKWLASDIQVIILFEYNGCDINDARLVRSGKSFNKWYNDKATFEISAKAGMSKRRGTSGCPECCSHSSIICFDVSLVIKYDFFCIDNYDWLVEISADGNVSIIEH